MSDKSISELKKTLAELKAETINIIDENNRLTVKILDLDKEIKQGKMSGINVESLSVLKNKLVENLNESLPFHKVMNNYHKIASLEKKLHNITVDIESASMATIVYKQVKSY